MMRWPLVTIAILGLAIIVISLIGQSDAFYMWLGAGGELRNLDLPGGETVKRSIDKVVFQHYPPSGYWAAIRISGGGIIGVALIGLRIEWKKRMQNDT